MQGNVPSTIFSISADESLPTELEMVMLALRPDDLLRGGDFQDAVDVDFEDDFKHGVTGLHRRDWRQRKFSQRRIVLTIYSLSLEDRKLDLGLAVTDSRKGPVDIVNKC